MTLAGCLFCSQPQHGAACPSEGALPLLFPAAGAIERIIRRLSAPRIHSTLEGSERPAAQVSEQRRRSECVCGLASASEPVGASGRRRTVVGRRRRSVKCARFVSFSLSLGCSRLASRNGNEFSSYSQITSSGSRAAAAALRMTRRDATRSRFSLRAQKSDVPELCLLVCGRRPLLLSRLWNLSDLLALSSKLKPCQSAGERRATTASEPNERQAGEAAGGDIEQRPN